MGGPPNQFDGPNRMDGPPMGPMGVNPAVLEVQEKVEMAVTPLCKVPIEAQLLQKEKMSFSLLEKLRQEICGGNPAANTWFLYQESKYNAILDMKKVMPSPLVTGYRNKCEFMIGEFNFLKLYIFL